MRRSRGWLAGIVAVLVLAGIVLYAAHPAHPDRAAACRAAFRAWESVALARVQSGTAYVKAPVPAEAGGHHFAIDASGKVTVDGVEGDSRCG